MSPSEAVYGFAGWLTGRKETTIMSSHDDAGCIASLVNEYCTAQGFEPPREGIWPKNMVSMPQ